MIGDQLGHFRITARLGAGGMGEVYRAEDAKLGREMAVEVLPEAFAADPDRMARFAREARVLASLNHPAIAAIYVVGEADVAAAEGTSLPRAQRPVPTMDPEAVTLAGCANEHQRSPEHGSILSVVLDVLEDWSRRRNGPHDRRSACPDES